MEKPTIYIAGPYGFTEAQKFFYYHEMIPKLGQHFELIDPWQLTEYEKVLAVTTMPEGPERKKAFNILNREIYLNNRVGIKKSQGGIFILDGVDVDSGTSFEMGVMSEQGKPMIGYRGDFRTSGDNDASEVNLMLTESIKEKSGIICHTLDELVQTSPKYFRAMLM